MQNSRALWQTVTNIAPTKLAWPWTKRQDYDNRGGGVTNHFLTSNASANLSMCGVFQTSNSGCGIGNIDHDWSGRKFRNFNNNRTKRLVVSIRGGVTTKVSAGSAGGGGSELRKRQSATAHDADQAILPIREGVFKSAEEPRGTDQ